MIETLTNLFTSLDGLVKLGVSVAVIAFAAFIVFKGGFTIAKALGAGLVGALVLWAVNGGLLNISEQVDKDLSAPISVELIVPGDQYDLAA